MHIKEYIPKNAIEKQAIDETKRFLFQNGHEGKVSFLDNGTDSVGFWTPRDRSITLHVNVCKAIAESEKMPLRTVMKNLAAHELKHDQDLGDHLMYKDEYDYAVTVASIKEIEEQPHIYRNKTHMLPELKEKEKMLREKCTQNVLKAEMVAWEKGKDLVSPDDHTQKEYNASNRGSFEEYKRQAKQQFPEKFEYKDLEHAYRMVETYGKLHKLQTQRKAEFEKENQITYGTSTNTENVKKYDPHKTPIHFDIHPDKRNFGMALTDQLDPRMTSPFAEKSNQGLDDLTKEASKRIDMQRNTQALHKDGLQVIVPIKEDTHDLMNKLLNMSDKDCKQTIVVFQSTHNVPEEVTDLCKARDIKTCYTLERFRETANEYAQNYQNEKLKQSILNKDVESASTFKRNNGTLSKKDKVSLAMHTDKDVKKTFQKVIENDYKKTASHSKSFQF